jgi:hypothetical protein
MSTHLQAWPYFDTSRDKSKLAPRPYQVKGLAHEHSSTAFLTVVTDAQSLINQAMYSRYTDDNSQILHAP